MKKPAHQKSQIHLKKKSQAGNAPRPLRDPLVKRKELATELGQSLTTLWRWTRDSYLPPPLRLGKTVGWPRSVVDAWKVEQGWPSPSQDEG